MKRNLEQIDAIGQEMMEYASEQGLIEGARAFTSNSTVENVPLTIYYHDGSKKTIYWNDVKAAREGTFS